ncbi:isochorismatase family protein [Kitasatospora phosalacinea]|uniref:isochorismatase family protein n=1 Tax=Kitasatospora phosalacinea TaxID=2065 RepID=UPI0036477EAE
MPGLPRIEPYPLPGDADLPPSTAAWTADPARAVLLVHDMQRYFLRPLPDALRTALVDNLAGLVAHARGAGMPVAYTAQPGDMTEGQRGLLADFWGPGMRTSPEDRQITEELAPAAGDWLLTKWRYSAFFNSELAELMQRHGRDQLILCGVYAHVGVLITAVEAFSRDVQTFLVADAVADFSWEHHRMALTYAAERCASVTTSRSVAHALAAA